MRDILKPFIPRRARHGNSARERWKFFAVGLGSLFEGAVIVLSLGYLNVEVRSWLLFEVFDDY